MWFRVGVLRDKDTEAERILKYYSEEQLGKADELRIIPYAEWEAAAREQYIKEYVYAGVPEEEAAKRTDRYFKREDAAKEIRSRYEMFVEDLKSGERHLSSLHGRICSLTGCLNLMQ